MLVEEAGGCCANCGYDSCIINLHFHHVDPSKKSFPMTVAMGKSIATFRGEAAKCVLVCANCHGEIEAGLIESPPAGATYATYGPRSQAALTVRRGELVPEMPTLGEDHRHVGRVAGLDHLAVALRAAGLDHR